MPVDYRIDSERRIVFSTGTGAVTVQEILAYQQRLRQDPAFSADFNQLFDYRTVSAEQLRTTDIQGLAETDVFSPGSRRAFVVSEDVTFGLARMFEMFRDSNERIVVFRNINEARRWLGLDDEKTS
jgi:hypothetical protein